MQIFANKVNNLPEDIRAYFMYELKKSTGGFMIKMYLLSKASGKPDPFLESLMVQWNISEEQFRKHTQELIKDGLLERD